MAELTREQVRDIFLRQVKETARYWSKVKFDRPVENEMLERCEGVAFSIMCILDGCTSLPGFIVAPCPHPEDKQYQIDNDGDDAEWYPENHESDVECDISGGLHELLHKV